MHRALRLPEIVNSILLSEASSPGFLHTCLSVNKLFSFETCRILWNWCGSTLEGAPAGNPRPQVRYLVKIIAADVQRAQNYASFIHRLSFSIEGEDYDSEARWHPQLAQLRFPALEEVLFLEAFSSSYMNTEDAISHYMQPGLREFTLYEGYDLSDSFLESLSQRCPSLQNLLLKTVGPNTISSETLVCYLERAPALKSLDISNGFEAIWSSRAFQLTSTYLHLEVLVLPRIEDDWIQAVLHNKPPSGVFPALTYLCTGVSDHSAARLAELMPNLRHLILSSAESSFSTSGETPSTRPQTLLSAAANFSQLEELDLKLGLESSVSGNELLLLAQSCSNLQTLSISTPCTTGITDDLIDTLARSMRSVVHFTLLSHNAVPLTFKSLHSLSQHCKNLEGLEISCSPSWDKHATSDSSVRFEHLWKLKLVPHGAHEQRLMDNLQSLQKLADCITALVPKLENFQIEDPNEAEEALVETVDSILV